MKPQNQILHTPKPKQKPCGEDSLHSSTTLPPPLKSLLPRSRFSGHPPYPFLAPSLPITVQSVARSFNHHEMQYSTTMPNDPDIHEDFKDVKDNPVMLYMKGVPDLPRCRFSSLAVRVLKEYNVPLIGLLKFTTDRGRIYLSTSRRNFRGIDMLNNDHMMTMFLAVTSTPAMAMVPFARTIITATMMPLTMTMTSSTVTTIVATISVITVTMLMNMMSPAMIVVLVNKMSPAMTVMPSNVASCTFVMSTGAVVS
ncbi:unnamed protein product [Camellia sinensis]